jgi:putative aldouronate transport system permease protein
MAIAERDATRRTGAVGASGEPKGPARGGPGSRRKRFRRDAALLAMMLPGVAYFLVFHYGALAGNVIAFKDYVPFDGLWASQWVGLSNFQAVLEDSAFWHAVVNTLWIALLQAVFQQVLGETGLLNNVLGDAHVHTLDVIGNPAAFKPLVVAQVIWKDCGWGTIIFLAALAQVDEQSYEAAAIDGAGPWRRFWHVTLPAIRPIIVLLLIMRLGDILSVGFEQMLLQRDSVGPEAAEIIDTLVWQRGLVQGDYGYAAAAGLFKGVVGALLVFAANKVAHRLGEQGVYR